MQNGEICRELQGRSRGSNHQADVSFFFISNFKDLHTMCVQYFSGNLHNFKTHRSSCERCQECTEPWKINIETSPKAIPYNCNLLCQVSRRYVFAFAHDGAVPATKTVQVMSQLCCGCKSNNCWVTAFGPIHEWPDEAGRFLPEQSNNGAAEVGFKTKKTRRRHADTLTLAVQFS